MTAFPAPRSQVRDVSPLDERLNRDCFCIDVDPDQVWSAVEAAAAGVVPIELLKQHRAHLFSSAPVFLSQADLAAMGEVVKAIEATAEQAAYQDAVRAWVYGFHCDETTMPFLALWYTLGVVVTGAFGALVARPLLRW